ncbi:hypothetical protein M413DRAFT_32382 [Hebeloma cylindrosporum]|uniref:Uncharacterized protein n=1 Tax=Hebeloma cylindrosporum TaxID=76867 RepID=A0A0C3BUA3_HEBCY|nr:hypothetical protein M413DRAFT_32382 [Hebeloma cylindrosporum h7]
MQTLFAFSDWKLLVGAANVLEQRQVSDPKGPLKDGPLLDALLIVEVLVFESVLIQEYNSDDAWVVHAVLL